MIRAAVIVLGAVACALLASAVLPWVPGASSIGVVSVGGAVLLALRPRVATFVASLVLLALALDVFRGGVVGVAPLIVTALVLLAWPIFRRALSVGDRGAIALGAVALALAEAVAAQIVSAGIPWGVRVAAGSVSAIAAALWALVGAFVTLHVRRSLAG